MRPCLLEANTVQCGGLGPLGGGYVWAEISKYPEFNSKSYVVGVLRGNTIRGNTTRNSERKMALREGL